MATLSSVVGGGDITAAAAAEPVVVRDPLPVWSSLYQNAPTTLIRGAQSIAFTQCDHGPECVQINYWGELTQCLWRTDDWFALSDCTPGGPWVPYIRVAEMVLPSTGYKVALKDGLVDVEWVDLPPAPEEDVGV